MWKAILLCVFMGQAVAHKVSYKDYKLIRFVLHTWDQMDKVEKFDKLEGVTVLKFPNIPPEAVEVMVAPNKVLDLMGMIGSANIINIKYITQDVQELIDMSTPQNQSSSFDFTSYHTLDKIYENLDDLAEQYPDKVQVIVGGQTFQGRRIKGVNISFKPNNSGVFIEGGIYPREWISPAVVMYMAHQILTSENRDIRNMAESYDWYIFPSFNPDGYVYTHTTDRMWNKNRNLGRFCCCFGTNLNRNWVYNFEMYKDRCSDKYGGMYPFSEVETKSMAAYIDTIRDKFFAYFSFQTMSGSLFYEEDPGAKYYLSEIARAGAIALEKKYGFVNWSWVYGFNEDLNTGDTVSYIKQKYNKHLAFTYQLGDKGQYGFLYPPKEIIPMGEGVLHSVKAMLRAAKNYKLVPQIDSVNTSTDANISHDA